MIARGAPAPVRFLIAPAAQSETLRARHSHPPCSGSERPLHAAAGIASGPPARTPRAGARSRRGSALRSVARRGRAAPSDRLRSAGSAPLTCSVRSEPGSLPRLPLKASTVRRNGRNPKWCRTSNLPVGTMLIHLQGGRQEQRRDWRGELEALPLAGVALTAPGGGVLDDGFDHFPLSVFLGTRPAPSKAKAPSRSPCPRWRRGSYPQDPPRRIHLAGPTSQA